MDIIIHNQNIGKRVDMFLTEFLKNRSLTRTIVQEYFQEGCLINGKKCKRNYKLKKDDVVKINFDYWDKIKQDLDLSKEIVPQEKDLDIRYEDKDIIVIFKPKGMVIHPGVNNTKNTLANYLRYYLESKGQYDGLMDRCGIVHRLDKGVSGLVVVAKNKKAQEFLRGQFKDRSIIKIYLAELEEFKNVDQKFKAQEYLKGLDIELKPWKKWQKVEGYIGRSRKNRYKMEFRRYQFKGSKYALSYMSFSGKYVLIKIETGRMHQIRSTLEYLGYSIKGDNLYGKSKENGGSIILEAVLLSFIKTDGERITLKTYE
jgi:23S rRNA pseudouridine1911/1915/1917 synthase